MKRRTMLNAAGAVALSLATGASRAAGYPDKPVRLIVPFQAGSGPDGLARVLADELTSRLEQPFVVENAPGAGGTIGASMLKRAQPDGYTLGLFANTHVINVHTFRTKPYDTARDFTPIGVLLTNATVLAVPASSPYQNLAELIAALKREPGKLNYGSGGKGSIAHLAVEVLLQRTGTQAAHIPYKSAVEIVNAMLGGQTQFGMPTLGIAASFVRNKQIRVLAIASATRSRLLPDTPTLIELMPNDGYIMDNWSGLFGPAHLPKPLVQRLFHEIAAVQSTGRFEAFLKSTGADTMRSESPEQFTNFVSDELRRYGGLMHSIGMDART